MKINNLNHVKVRGELVLERVEVDLFAVEFNLFGLERRGFSGAGQLEVARCNVAGCDGVQQRLERRVSFRAARALPWTARRLCAVQLL